MASDEIEHDDFHENGRWGKTGQEGPIAAGKGGGIGLN